MVLLVTALLAPVAWAIVGAFGFPLATFWLVAVLGIIWAAGYSEHPMTFVGIRGPKISDAVQIALISGLSVNVIGLLAIVINYLFPKRDGL